MQAENKREFYKSAAFVMAVLALLGWFVHVVDDTPAPQAAAHAAATAAATAAAKAQVFTAKDFMFDKSVLEKNRELIVTGVNRIHQQDSRCATLDPADSGPDPDAKHGQTQFFVLCSHAVVVTFTPHDITSGKVFHAPTYFADKGEAIEICEPYAKMRTAFPASIDFDWREPVEQRPDGSTVVGLTYSAKNGFGVPLRLAAMCTFDDKAMVAGNVGPARE